MLLQSSIPHSTQRSMEKAARRFKYGFDTGVRRIPVLRHAHDHQGSGWDEGAQDTFEQAQEAAKKQSSRQAVGAMLHKPDKARDAARGQARARKQRYGCSFTGPEDEIAEVYVKSRDRLDRIVERIVGN